MVVMKKAIKKFLFIVFLLVIIAVSIGLMVVQSGYNMYKEALEQENPAELPQIYIDAVYL